MGNKNFEETHNLYIVEETSDNGTLIDVKRNRECLDKMLGCVDKVLENLKQ